MNDIHNLKQELQVVSRPEDNKDQKNKSSSQSPPSDSQQNANSKNGVAVSLMNEKSKAMFETSNQPKQEPEDLEDVDESEMDYDSEDRAHDRVNMIPNSQVNRNQQSESRMSRIS